MRKLIVAALSAAVLLALVVAALQLRETRVAEVREIAPPDRPPWAVHTAKVATESLEVDFPVLATVSTSAELTVMSLIEGIIVEMTVHEGEAVRAGAVLARVDVREINEKRAGLEAQLDAARAEAVRQVDELSKEKRLLEVGGSSPTAVEARRTATVAAEKRVRALEKEIAALDVRRGYGTIKATADGIVAERLREPGDICQPGHPLYRLTVSKGARVKVRLPQDVLMRIRAGSTLVLERGEKDLTLALSRIYPSLDSDDLGTAEADLRERPFGLPSGSRIAGRVILKKLQDGLVIPTSALISPKDGRAQVLKVVRQGRQVTVKRVEVEVLLDSRGKAAVSGGLDSGDEIVVAQEGYLLKLRDGDTVQVVQGGPS